MDYSQFKEPFEGYGWHWGAATPTESFNRPEIFLGCLRVLYANQGKKPNAESVYNDLKVVEADLDIKEPKLARSKDRNLFRNSGQYWKNLGVLETTKPFIKLTRLGDAYATGRITKNEFSCYIIKTMSLPKIEQESSKIFDRWVLNDLTIKPLELLLEVLAFLFSIDESCSYLTPREIIRVIIPFSGHKFPIEELVKALLSFRQNERDFDSTWHPCIFNKNNKKNNNMRIAREFLYFLNLYGFLDCRDSRLGLKGNSYQEFFISSRSHYEAIMRLLKVDVKNDYLDIINLSITLDKESEISDLIRERKLVGILSRPNQTKFRKEVLKAAGNRCLITNITTLDVLQACHIKQVCDQGSDHISNGIILRVDLHLLYDKGHLKITENGDLLFSEYLMQDGYYSSTLPKKIIIPDYVNKNALRKRNSYSDY